MKDIKIKEIRQTLERVCITTTALDMNTTPAIENYGLGDLQKDFKKLDRFITDVKKLIKENEELKVLLAKERKRLNDEQCCNEELKRQIHCLKCEYDDAEFCKGCEYEKMKEQNNASWRQN